MERRAVNPPVARPTAESSNGRVSATAGESWQPFVRGVRAFVARRVPIQDADDVVQEVLLRLHRGADSLRDEARAESWAYGIARRTIADYYRSRPPATVSDDLLDPVDPSPTPGEAAASYAGDHSVHEEVLSWLRPMAEELPETYREALLMADFEGKPQRLVAEALGLSLSGAKSRVQRARALLGQRLRECCQVELDPAGRAVDFERRDTESCDCEC